MNSIKLPYWKQIYRQLWKMRQNANDTGGSTKCSRVLQTEARLTMCRLSAIIGLLFCVIVTRADELPVIKDSDAVYYVGKNVEVRGLVVSVTTSPLGTAFINFEREYPNQTFAALHRHHQTQGNDGVVSLQPVPGLKAVEAAQRRKSANQRQRKNYPSNQSHLLSCAIG